MIFKFLLITFIVLFIVFKLIGFFFKLFIKGAVNNFQQQQSNNQGPYNNQRNRQFSEGNINIDYVPEKKKDRPDKNFKGGEYIDYEEVK